MKRLPLHFGISVFKFQVHTNAIIAFWLLFDIFGEAMGLKGPKVFPFWCLMPKGEKLRPKQLDQPTTCEFQK
jgi:hypothetical protein